MWWRACVVLSPSVPVYTNNRILMVVAVAEHVLNANVSKDKFVQHYLQRHIVYALFSTCWRLELFSARTSSGVCCPRNGTVLPLSSLSHCCFPGLTCCHTHWTQAVVKQQLCHPAGTEQLPCCNFWLYGEPCKLDSVDLHSTQGSGAQSWYSGVGPKSVIPP